MLAASLQNVSSYYGAETVLQGVTFRISEGQKLGPIGAKRLRQDHRARDIGGPAGAFCRASRHP